MSETTQPKDQPLTVALEGDQVVIRIGIDTLACAVEQSDYFQEGEGKVKRKRIFAKEVIDALQAEEEDGTNLMHVMFDQAAINAVEDGAQGADFPDE